MEWDMPGCGHGTSGHDAAALLVADVLGNVIGFVLFALQKCLHSNVHELLVRGGVMHLVLVVTREDKEG